MPFSASRRASLPPLLQHQKIFYNFFFYLRDRKKRTVSVQVNSGAKEFPVVVELQANNFELTSLNFGRQARQIFLKCVSS